MNTRLRLLFSFVVIAACSGVAFVGGFWMTLSGGLLAGYGTDPEYCRDVPSSAADADLSVQLLVVLVIPALVRLLRIRHQIGALEFLMMPAFIVFATGMLAIMECGDLARHPPYGTIIRTGLLAYGLAACALIFVRWPKLILP
jgi:hypothetical protein